MENCEHARKIGKPVQGLPAPEAEPLHPALRRGHGERQQTAPGGEADRDEPALDDVLADRPEVEPLIDPDVRREMHRGIEEGEQPEHPPDPQRPFPSGDELERRASERAEEEDERVEAQPVQHFGDGIGTEAAAHRATGEPEQRRERAEKDEGLEKAIGRGPQ